MSKPPDHDQFERERRHAERLRQIEAAVERVCWDLFRLETEQLLEDIQRDYSEEREFGWALDTEDQRRSH